MQAPGRHRGVVSEINVTPMADIMIVLLIIFMVATPYITRASVPLPLAAHTAERPPEHLRVALGADGAITLAGLPVAGTEGLRAELQRRLAGSGPLSVTIEADRQAEYAQIARILEACRLAGVEEVGLAAQPRVAE